MTSDSSASSVPAVAGEVLAIPSAIVSATALTLPDDAPLTFAAAVGLLRQCATVQDASHYWRGDVYLWIERRYGRDALQQEIGEDEYDVLRPYIWVSERVSPERRDRRLSWSHCRVVATLESTKQAEWLTRAGDEGWTVLELREAIRGPTKVNNRIPLGVRDALLLLSQDRIGQVWTVEDDLTLRTAIGAVET